MSDASPPFLSVVIPAYNEQSRLGNTLQAVCDFLKRQAYDWEIIVVDDGSTDETPQIVQRAQQNDSRIQLLQDHPNRGKGRAVRLGMLHAMGKYRLFMDADNSTSIDHVDHFLPLLQNDAQVVIGSRAVNGAQVLVHQSRWKELLGRLGNRWIQMWTVHGIKDTQAGFKIFTARAATEIFSAARINGWAFDVELLLIARLRDYKIVEHPIDWINSPDSKVMLKSYLEVLKDVVKIRLNAWRKIYSPSPKASNA